MEVVCEGKHWDVALYAEGSDSEPAPSMVQAALPYLLGAKCGLRYVIQPQLTQFGGPWYRYTEAMCAEGGENLRLEFESKATEALISSLKKQRITYFQQNFSPMVTNWLPFYWEGFRQTTRYTYRINDISNPQLVFAHFDASRRQRQIRRLESRYKVTDDLTPERFAEFHAQYWQSRGQRDLLSQQFIVRVVTAALSRGQGLLLGLHDEDDVLRAARFVVYDDRTAYSLLSALHPVHHGNGASALLFWHIIQRLSGVARAFDFEGSMDRGIEQSYRLYGAVQTPYFQVKKLFV